MKKEKERMRVVSVRNEDGSLTGWLLDMPQIIVEAEDHVELLEKLMDAIRVFSEINNQEY